MPAWGLASLIAANPAHRAALKQAFASLHIGESNPFSITAFEAAYRHGEPWLNELLPYLQANLDYVRDYIRRYLAPIALIEPEGTYLLWLDCRALGLNDQDLGRFFIDRARLGLNAGYSFGSAGSGFMRLNIACRRAVLTEALTRLRTALAV